MATRISCDRVTNLQRQQVAQRNNIDKLVEENAAHRERILELKATVSKLEGRIDEHISDLRTLDNRESETNAELRRLRYFRWQHEALVAFIREEKEKATAKSQTNLPVHEKCDRQQQEPEVTDKLDARARLKLLTMRQNVFTTRVFGIQRTLELMELEESTIQSYSNRTKLGKPQVKRLREIKNHRRILMEEQKEADAEVSEMEKQRRNFQISARKREATEDDPKTSDILITQMQALLDHAKLQHARQLKVSSTSYAYSIVCWL